VAHPLSAKAGTNFAGKRRVRFQVCETGFLLDNVAQRYGGTDSAHKSGCLTASRLMSLLLVDVKARRTARGWRGGGGGTIDTLQHLLRHSAYCNVYSGTSRHGRFVTFSVTSAKVFRKWITHSFVSRLRNFSWYRQSSALRNHGLRSAQQVTAKQSHDTRWG
jgi:hypothetical protein